VHRPTPASGNCSARPSIGNLGGFRGERVIAALGACKHLSPRVLHVDVSVISAKGRERGIKRRRDQTMLKASEETDSEISPRGTGSFAEMAKRFRVYRGTSARRERERETLSTPMMQRARARV